MEFLEKCADPKRQGKPSFTPVGVMVGARCLSCATVSLSMNLGISECPACSHFSN